VKKVFIAISRHIYPRSFENSQLKTAFLSFGDQRLFYDLAMKIKFLEESLAFCLAFLAGVAGIEPTT